MIFPERVVSVGPGDRVLEVGPGLSPHPKATVLLDLEYDDEEAYLRQVGQKQLTERPHGVVTYKGGRFPFETKEFDYTICAQVLEHVEDVPAFLSEVFRVSRRGYIEYPTIYYEYLYNFFVHRQLLRMKEGVLLYLPKSETQLEKFIGVQRGFHRSLELGHDSFVVALRPIMFEGFEWNGPFEVRKALSIDELVVSSDSVPPAARAADATHTPLIARIWRRLLRLRQMAGNG